jgi:hypothetical protein
MEPGSNSSIIPFCKTYAKAELASIHNSVFIELLAMVPAEPLSFGSASFYDPPNNESQLLQVIPPDPFLVMEDQYFTSVALHQNMSDVHFDDLTSMMLNFFSQP